MFRSPVTVIDPVFPPDAVFRMAAVPEDGVCFLVVTPDGQVWDRGVGRMGWKWRYWNDYSERMDSLKATIIAMKYKTITRSEMYFLLGEPQPHDPELYVPEGL